MSNSSQNAVGSGLELGESAPRVSVVVPVYNTRHNLQEAVQSVLAQTETSLELILVDDGSDEDVAQLCDELAEWDPRIRVIHKSNGGPSSARNVGLDSATGEFVSFMDSDDLYEPEMLEITTGALIQSGLDCARVEYSYLEGDSKAPNPSHLSAGVLAPPEGFLRLILKMCEQVETPFVWQHVFRRSMVGSVRFPLDCNFGEDLVFLVDVLAVANSLTCVAASLYVYRHSEEGLSKSKEKTLGNLLMMAKVSARVVNRVASFPGATSRDVAAVARARILAVLRRHVREIATLRVSAAGYRELCGKLNHAGYLTEMRVSNPELPIWARLMLGAIENGRYRLVWLAARSGSIVFVARAKLKEARGRYRLGG